MATEVKPAKAPRAPKAPVALTTRITEQLNRAVLARKMTKAELQALSAHIEKLNAFVES